MMYEITKREQEHPETAEQNEREIMEYICAHRQECELVLEKCLLAANTNPSGMSSSTICSRPFRLL